MTYQRENQLNYISVLLPHSFFSIKMLVGKAVDKVLSNERSWSVATDNNICGVYTDGVIEPLIIPKAHRFLDVIPVW
jgi:hypothetical protein